MGRVGSSEWLDGYNALSASAAQERERHMLLRLVDHAALRHWAQSARPHSCHHSSAPGAYGRARSRQRFATRHVDLARHAGPTARTRVLDEPADDAASETPIQRESSLEHAPETSRTASTFCLYRRDRRFETQEHRERVGCSEWLYGTATTVWPPRPAALLEITPGACHRPGSPLPQAFGPMRWQNDRLPEQANKSF